jgi:hypothetical protein
MYLGQRTAVRVSVFVRTKLIKDILNGLDDIQ